MKVDQVAFYCPRKEDEEKMKEALGLKDKAWVKDTVTARGRVYGTNASNIAELQFNYDLGIELELLRYTTGLHWHMQKQSAEGPFVSHIGVHLDDGEPFPDMPGCKLVQEVFTLSHTAEYLTTGGGAGRKYHYRIHELSPGTYIKFIRRIHPKDREIKSLKNETEHLDAQIQTLLREAEETPTEEKIARALYDSDEQADPTGVTWDEAAPHWKNEYRRRGRAVLVLFETKDREIEDWRGRLATQCGKTLVAEQEIERLKADRDRWKLRYEARTVT